MAKTNIGSFQGTAMEELVIANESIQTTLQRIYSGVKSNINFTDNFKSVVPYVKGVVDSFRNSFDYEEIKKLNKDQNDFLNIIKDISYSELREIRAFKPEGLKATYLELIEHLEKEVAYSLTVEENVFKPYIFLLGNLVSNDDAYKTLDTNEALNNKLEQRRLKSFQEISKLYDANSSEVTTTIGKVVDRNNDWPVILAKLNKLLDTLELIDRVSLQKDINICAEYVDIIVDKIDDESVTAVTPEAVRKLTNTTLQVAKEIEAISITYFRVLTLKGAIENTIAQVKDVYK